MCRKILQEKQTQVKFVGSYSKGNEPCDLYLMIHLAPCECDEKVWGRIGNDLGVWVEIESVIP